MKNHKQVKAYVELIADVYDGSVALSEDMFNRDEIFARYEENRKLPYYTNMPPSEDMVGVEIQFKLNHNMDYPECYGCSIVAEITGWLPMTPKEIQQEQKRQERAKIAAEKRKQKAAEKKAKELEKEKAFLLKRVKSLAKQDPSLIEELKNDI